MRGALARIARKRRRNSEADAQRAQKAEAQYQAGEHKRAVDTLWEVTFVGAHAETDARQVIALATQLKEVTQGGVRRDCEEHIARAERFLDLAGDPDAPPPAVTDAAARRGGALRA